MTTGKGQSNCGYTVPPPKELTYEEYFDKILSEEQADKIFREIHLEGKFDPPRVWNKNMPARFKPWGHKKKIMLAVRVNQQCVERELDSYARLFKDAVVNFTSRTVELSRWKYCYVTPHEICQKIIGMEYDKLDITDDVLLTKQVMAQLKARLRLEVPKITGVWIDEGALIPKEVWRKIKT